MAIRDSVLSIVDAAGGSTEDVGPRTSDALDRLLDTLAGEDVSAGMRTSDVVAAIAEHVSGGSGGVTDGDKAKIRAKGLTTGGRVIFTLYSEKPSVIGESYPSIALFNSTWENAVTNLTHITGGVYVAVTDYNGARKVTSVTVDDTPIDIDVLAGTTRGFWIPDNVTKSSVVMMIFE